MRLSIDRADPGFRPEVLRHQETYDVFLDGDLVEGVVTADEEEGHVIAYARDDEGTFRHRDGELLRIVRRGDVRIVRTR